MCLSNLFGNNSICWIILIILVLFLVCGNGCNTGNDCGCNPC